MELICSACQKSITPFHYCRYCGSNYCKEHFQGHACQTKPASEPMMEVPVKFIKRVAHVPIDNTYLINEVSMEAFTLLAARAKEDKPVPPHDSMLWAKILIWESARMGRTNNNALTSVQSIDNYLAAVSARDMAKGAVNFLVREKFSEHGNALPIARAELTTREAELAKVVGESYGRFSIFAIIADA
jgi:hypothetical protein